MSSSPDPDPADQDFAVVASITTNVVDVGGGVVEPREDISRIKVLRRSVKDQLSFHARCVTKSTAAKKAIRSTFSHIVRYGHFCLINFEVW